LTIYGRIRMLMIGVVVAPTRTMQALPAANTTGTKNTDTPSHDNPTEPSKSNAPTEAP